MGTAVQWAKCWLLLSTIRNIYSTGNVAHNRTEVEFNDVGPGGNWTEIEENNFINLTVRLNDRNVSTIKISHQQNNLTVDLCKFSLKTTCEVSDSSHNLSHCQCLKNQTIQFLKKASSSDSGFYTWTWRDGKTPDKHRDIFINVRKANAHTGNRSDDTVWAATTATIVCILLTVVVTATAGVVFWKRNKAKCSIDVRDCGRYYRSRDSDHAIDNQINGQTVNTVDNHPSSVVNEPTLNHIHDPNYADVNDAIHPDDPNYDDIKEDKSQPPESSYLNKEILFHGDSSYLNEINIKKRSNDLPDANVKMQGKSQSTDHTKPSVNSRDASQLPDPYYSDIKEPTMSHDYDNNHTNCTEHDYADINEHETSQPPDPDNSNINQHSSHSCDPKYTDVKVEESSKPDDPNCTHVMKQIMRHPDNSTDAQVKTWDTIQPDDLFYHEVNKQEAGLAVDTVYPQVNEQDTEQESVYSPKDEQKPVSPHHPTYLQGQEDTTGRGFFVYNHLHEIHQHNDPNYDHTKTNRRQSADLTFQ